jgi:hypothetical protein
MKRTRIPVIMLVLTLAGAFWTFTARGQTGPDDSTVPVTADIPSIQLLVYRVEDPYTGTITNPATLDPNARYIGVEVAIVNNGDYPVSTAWSSIRLRDSLGRDYAGGSVRGTDEPLRGRELANGETNRGWVWFAVPADAEITTILYVPPATEIRIVWNEVPHILRSPATPLATPQP